MADFDADRNPEVRERDAARWALHLEGGLIPAEETELARWLAADPRNAATLAEHRRTWARFSPLAELAAAKSAPPDEPAIPAPRSWTRILQFAVPATAAAAIAAGVFLRSTARLPETAAAPMVTAALPARCEQRRLADGSVVELNRGAELTELFSVAERRVRLVRGEAKFTVASDSSRPFIVMAQGVEVRAVGTVFNVRLSQTSAEVLVTEGAVRVNHSPWSAAGAAGPSVLVSVGQQVVVPHHGGDLPPVAALSAADIERQLAWQPRLLEFDDVPLAAIIAEFNRRNPVRLVVADSALGALRMTAALRSDNVAGFVRLLEANYGVRVEKRAEAELVLRRK
ncbi:MAG: FecR domain-containing protein [Verrucomicrobia bacterium]|nr:FecR domain-containing protein [Verrucomicrobiota bacterium]